MTALFDPVNAIERARALRGAGVADEVCVHQPGPTAVESLAQIVDALHT